MKVVNNRLAKELTVNPFELRLCLHQCLQGQIETKREPSEKGLSTWFWGKEPIGGRYLKFAIYSQVEEALVLFVQTSSEILTQSDVWLHLTFQLMLRSCPEKCFVIDYHPLWEKGADDRCGSTLKCYIWHDGKDPEKNKRSYIDGLLKAYQKLWSQKVR